MLVPKSASFPYPTCLHAPKRGVFGKAIYQSLLIYGVYWIRTIKSDQTYVVYSYPSYKSDLIFIVYQNQVNKSAQIYAV